jgi:DNA-binding NtrC family response regulator
VENELFGHARGAFTGANSSEEGLIHEADHGTLFLDEIDCLPSLAQAKLLRFLQDKEYKQLGSKSIQHANVRIIAATNISLEKAVQEGKFRQDLFYRLNIIPLALPALRARREDIPLLARHFLDKYNLEFNKALTDFGADAMHMLMLYQWPGNVRELESVVERAVIFCEETMVRSSDIVLQAGPEPRSQVWSFQEAKAQVIEHFEKEYVEHLLLAQKGNITKAAAMAGKNRRAFWELIRRHKINVQQCKPSLSRTG